MILNVLAVFIGGGIGATLRYVMGVLCSRHISCDFPLITLGINFLSCFIIGLALAYFLNRPFVNPAWKLAATVGFCGGLSTVSTFSVETLNLLKNGNYGFAGAYIIFTFALCLVSTYFGFKIGIKLFFGI